MTKRRLVYFDFVTHYGGAQRSTVTLLKALTSRFDVHVVDAYGVSQEYTRALLAQDVDVTVLQPGAGVCYIGANGQGMKRVLNLVRQLPALWHLGRRLRDRVDALQPDILLTNSYKALALLYASGMYSRSRVAFYARGWYRRSQVPLLARYLIKRCHCILAVSPATAQALLQWRVPRHRIHVAPTIMDMDHVMAQGALALADPPPHMDRSKRIVVPAQLVPTKGQHTALEAAHLLKQRGHDFVMWLCGDVKMGVAPGYRRRLANMIGEYGLQDHCYLLGQRQDLPALVSRADVLVLPTHTEGFPRTVWEAMLLGCPVVATPVGGIVDLVTDGKTGLLFGLDDKVALAAAIERVFTDGPLARELTTNARAFVLERYGPAEAQRQVEMALCAAC